MNVIAAVPASPVSVRARIRAFILENFYVPEPDRLADDESLVRRGVVDSTGFLEVIGFLEAELGLAIEDQELVPDNFETIARIAAFVERKLASCSRSSAPGGPR
ncbi:MAG: acyl carrier protein [Deltaproteobacteria bacterium]